MIGFLLPTRSITLIAVSDYQTVILLFFLLQSLKNYASYMKLSTVESVKDLEISLPKLKNGHSSGSEVSITKRARRRLMS